MVRLFRTKEIFVITFLIIQIVNASPLGFCSCSSRTSCPKNNDYCRIIIPPCSCTNYQNCQSSHCQNSPCSCCNCNDLQNIEICYQPANIGRSLCGCYNRVPYNTKIPPTITPSPRCSYIYATDNPPISCPSQTFKNFEYQLQLPISSRCMPNYGIVDKTLKKNP